MPQYRYRPADNRTPVNDPVLGHLDYDGVYDDPRCADDPRFEEVPARKDPRSRADLNGAAKAAGIPDPHKLPNRQAVIDALAEHAASTAPEPPAEPAASADTPAAHEQADAGDAGRSHS